MIPVSDTTPTRTFPVVNYTIIILNILAFLFEVSLGSHLQSFIATWAVVPDRILNWHQHPWVLLTLITAQFLHGGWMHVGGNMLYLWIFGDNVEEEMGHGRYLFFYLFGGVVASMAQILSHPHSTIPTLGASGAIAAVLGAYLVYFPRGGVTVLVPVFFYMEFVTLPAIFVLGTWFLEQLLNGTLSISTGAAVTGGIAWWAHIGGFVTGLVLGPLFRRRRRFHTLPPNYW
jgi:membrane associated rhomboid family serine protease